MPGTLPGLPGLFAFAGIKFVGYSLAASALKKYEPTILSSATAIAAARTALGFVLGPPATLLGAFLAGVLLFRDHYSPLQNSAIYGFLFLARIFIWALLLYIFTRKAPIPKSSLWLYSLLGALLSSLLDIPGYSLAMAAPGQIVFC